MTPAFSSELNRRKYPRRALKAQVGVVMRGTYFVARAGELGEGGLAFTTDMVMPEGSQLVVSFQIPHGDFVSVRALVRSLTKIEGTETVSIGLSFENMTFANKRQIRAFVSARTFESQLKAT